MKSPLMQEGVDLPEPKVFVVDDDHALRESLRWLVQSLGLAVEVFANAEDFLAAYDCTQPGCLVLDVRLPGISGLNLQDQLAARGLSLPVILITGHAEFSTAVRGLRAGAVDFLEKPFSDQELLDRIREAIGADRAARLVEAERAEVTALVSLLTEREREVMTLVVAGKSNKVIAAELSLSPKTVEVHRAHVMRKLQVESVADLVRLAALLAPDKDKSRSAPSDTSSDTSKGNP